MTCIKGPKSLSLQSSVLIDGKLLIGLEICALMSGESQKVCNFLTSHFSTTFDCSVYILSKGVKGTSDENASSCNHGQLY